MTPTLSLRGFDVWKQFLSPEQQEDLVSDLRQRVVKTPLFTPKTRFGKPMTVRMTSFGKMGWYSDQRGYRYVEQHPNGTAWPEIPPQILALWRQIVTDKRDPECCLLNYYDRNAKMGLHQDRDEADFSWPVLSVSLGDDALFRIGNTTKGGKTEALWLQSGDVVVMGGAARLTFHGIEKLRFGSSSLLQQSGRINLTCRVVT